VPAGLIDRHDLIDTLDRAAVKQVTIISAPAGSGKTSLLHAWAERSGQQRRIAFMSVQPGQHDAQLVWLTLLGAVRAATGGGEPPAAAPGFNGQAMVDKVRSELATASPFGLIIDDLHELSSAEAVDQLAALLTSLPPGVHAVVAARRELRAVIDRSAPVNPYLTLVEAHLLDALACRDLGDERASRAAVERALNLAEPDRLILPFAMTGAWQLLTALPPQDASHAALGA
jgi:ATP/maltotriose-dependent transcriptional regulator MalT